MASALRQLSSWYDNPQLSPAEQQQLTQLLDQVAGTVVYSTQHLLEAALRSAARRAAGRHRPAIQRALAAVGQDQRHRRSAEHAAGRTTESRARSVQRRRQSREAATDAAVGRRLVRRPISHRHRPRATAARRRLRRVRQGRQSGLSRPRSSHRRRRPRQPATASAGSDWATTWASTARTAPKTSAAPICPGSISLSPRDVEDVFDILSLGSKVTIRR